MGAANLAIIFSPLVLYPRDPSFAEMLFASTAMTNNMKSVLQLMIDNQDEIFIELEKQPNPFERRMTVA
jgi:hypothetical protein